MEKLIKILFNMFCIISATSGIIVMSGFCIVAFMAFFELITGVKL